MPQNKQVVRGLSISSYASQMRDAFPDKGYLTDREIAKQYLRLYPNHRESIDPKELDDLYSIQANQRGSDFGFSQFQFKEMISSIPAGVAGGVAAITGSKDLLDYSEELRENALKDTQRRMQDPEIQGYLKWIEDEPINLNNFYQPQMFQRGLAQAAPSIATIVAVDVGLNLATYGIGGTLLKAGTGGFKALKMARKAKTAKELAEAPQAAVNYLKIKDRIRTGGTMTTMGIMEGSEKYNSTMDYLLEQGVDVEQANKISAVAMAAYGVAASILEQIPYAAFKNKLGIGSIKHRAQFEKRIADALERQGAWKTGKTISKAMMTQAIIEGGTEEAQFQTSALTDYYIKRGYEEVPVSALQYLKNQIFTPESIESAYSGAVMGLTMGFLPGVNTARLSGKSRIEKVLQDVDNIEDLPPEVNQERQQQAEKPKSQNTGRIKLGAFVGSYDNFTPAEKEIAQSLKDDYLNNPERSAQDMLEIIDNEPELLNNLTDDERFDIFSLVSALDENSEIDDLQKRYEKSLLDEQVDEVDVADEPVDEVVDEVIDEEESALDITPKEEVVKPKKTKTKKDKPLKGLDAQKVDISVKDGEIKASINDENVNLKDEEIDEIQTAIASFNEDNSTEKLEEAKLTILNRVNDEVVDEISDEIVDEPISQEEEEARALDITPKKETLSSVRIEAYKAGVKNVKSYKSIDELKKQIKLEKDRKTELEAVEAKTKALNPEVFEDEISDDPVLQERLDEIEEEFKPEPLTKSLIKKLGLNEKEQKEWVENSKIDYQKFKDDPIAFINEKISSFQKSLDKGSLDDTPDAKKRLQKRVNNMKRVLALLPPSTLRSKIPSVVNEEVKGKPTLNSGGAAGADSVFEKFAIAAGHVVKAMSFKGHDTKSKNRKKIIPSLLQKADKFIKKANKTLKRTIPNKNYVRNLLRRNYYQVKDVNQVIAVGHLTPLKNEVRGGTGWAVQMAIDLGRVENKMADKDIHVFNLAKNEWTKWDGKKFVKAEAPSLSNNYAGIGARPYSKENLFGITKEGEAAIKALYEKPKETTKQEKAIKETDDIIAKKEVSRQDEQAENMPEMLKQEIDESKDAEKNVEKSIKESKEKIEEKPNVDEPIKHNLTDDIFQSRKDSENFVYTEGQKNVLTSIVKFLKDVKDEYFVFAGYAGTGKTTLVENIVNYINVKNKKEGKENGVVYIAAPTNKAVLRLEEKSKDEKGKPKYDAKHSTLHSLLYGQPDEESGKFELKSQSFSKDDILIVDESSMINGKIWDDIKTKFIKNGIKVIFIGDGFQLEAIKETGYENPELTDRWKQKGAQIKEVVRQAAESSIIKLATIIRIKKQMFFPSKSSDDVVLQSKNDMLDEYYKHVKEGLNSILIVAKNTTRQFYNNKARFAKWGTESKNPLNEGESVISVNNASAGKRNGEISVVGEIVSISEPIKVDVEVYDNKTKQMILKPQNLYAYVHLDENGNKKYDFFTDTLKDASFHGSQINKASRVMLYEDYPMWMGMTKKGNIILNEATNINTYGYAITAHKSQGSEWDNVFIGELQTWGSSLGQAKWLYTSVTRAAKKLYAPSEFVNSGNSSNWELMTFVFNRDMLTKNDKTNEKLQEISKGQRIDSNKDLAKKIAKRLKKQFPFIEALAVQRVYDRFGREVAGKAIDSMVMWSINKGTLDTVPHEYAHIYIDLLRNSPIVKMGIQKFKLSEDTDAMAEERLVQHMGEYYANRIQNKSFFKKLGIWLRQFWLNIKKPFDKMSKKEIGDYLGEKFYQDSISKQTVDTTGVERLQEIPPQSPAWMESLRVIDNYFEKFSKEIRRNAGFLKRRQFGSDTNALITAYLEVLTNSDFKPIFEPVLSHWLDKKLYEKDKSHAVEYAVKDSYDFMEEFAEELNRNISSVSTRDSNLRIINKSKDIFKKGLGIITNTNMKILTDSIKFNTINDFMKLLANRLGKPFDSLTPENKRAGVRFYNHVESQKKVNQKEVKDNDTTFYKLDLIETIPNNWDWILTPKIDVEQDGTTNPERDRKRMIENSEDMKDISWIHGDDITVIAQTPNPMTVELGDPQSHYASFKQNDLKKLQRVVRDKGFVLFINRGEQERYGLVKITKQNKEDGKRAEEYWDEQGVTKKQKDNFLGKRFEGIKKFNQLRWRTEEIARYEATNKVFGDFLEHEGSKVFKRVKLPLTPAVISSDMPSAVGFIFKKENATFVTKKDGKDEVVSAIVDIEGNKKYLLDGASLSGSRLFKMFSKYLGILPSSSKAKTVIHALVNNAIGEASKLYVKHQHFKPPFSGSIYENYGKNNQKLIATIDENGKITNEDGKEIDVLFTDDEAKIFDGDFKMGELFEIPGKAFGLLNFPDNHHTRARHSLQLYNYIHNKQILDLWKTEMFPKIQNRLRKAFLLGRTMKGRNAQTNIANFIETLAANEEGFPDVVVEMFKNGMGQHPFGASLIDKLVQTQIVEDALNLANNPGFSGDTIVDVTNTLEYTEVGASIKDASVVISAYMDDVANHGDNRNFKDLQTNGIDLINRWLKTANFQMLITRSPVSHLGGAKMVTVKYLHNKDGQLHLNALLLYKDLEGDGDGDKVSLEKLPESLENEFIKLYEELEVKAIDLNKYTKDSKNYDLSLREDLFELIEAVTWGQKAIPEIANMATFFGVMEETLNFIELKDRKGKPYKITPRKSSDVILDKKSNIRDSVDQLLRIYLQAAADNVEFLLLGKWEYSRNNLFNIIFKKDNNEPLDERDIKIIDKMYRNNNYVNDIRRGDSFQTSEKFSLKDTISFSETYSNFTASKANWMYKIPEMAGGRVSFKPGLHPFEMIAIEVDRMYSKYKISLHEGTPSVLHENIYFSAHLTSISKMQSSINNAINEALADDNLGRGFLYGQQMGTEFSQLFKEVELENLGLDAWNTNDKMLKFADKFNLEFARLNPKQKTIATYTFLQGYSRIVNGVLKKVAEISTIPPHSKDPLKLNLLDAKVMNEYFNYYNEFLSEQIESASKSLLKKPTGRDYIDNKLTYKELNQGEDTRIVAIENLIKLPRIVKRSRLDRDIEEHC